MLLICGGCNLLAAQTLPNDRDVLQRRYREGEKLTYQMKGINEAWRYDVRADGKVMRNAAGVYFEEYSWSNLISDNQRVPLSTESLDFREKVTLDVRGNQANPNLSQVDPRLVGPITDFMTFYVDLWLAEKTEKLVQAGDHFYLKRDKPNSWADGIRVLIGEDSVDFDISLKEVNRLEKTATIFIRHVPPEEPKVQLPADWMRKPVADTPNNWVQVQKMESGKYLAAVGKESFDVEIVVSLTDGKILSGRLDNPVKTIERECVDAALSACGDPIPHSIRRQIEISLESSVAPSSPIR